MSTDRRALIGATVYIYGRDEARILEPDDEGAIVREPDDNSETWFPWDVLHEKPFVTNVTCPVHGGTWGSDPTCAKCTNEWGGPLPVPSLVVNERAVTTVIAASVLGFLAGLVTASAITLPAVMR